MIGSTAVQHTKVAAETPGVDRLLMVAILTSGAVAAVFAMPILWVVTPVMAWYIHHSSRRAAAESIEVHLQYVASEFPTELQVLIDSTTRQLCAGDARALLANVVRQARPLFAERESSFDALTEADTRVEITDLVRAACETALELGRLDVAAPGVEQDPGLVSRYRHARSILIERLRDAATALSEMYASNVEHGTVASDRVGELASEVRADARARQAALHELSS